jgi:hypothetical protein
MRTVRPCPAGAGGSVLCGRYPASPIPSGVISIPVTAMRGRSPGIGYPERRPSTARPVVRPRGARGRRRHRLPRRQHREPVPPNHDHLPASLPCSTSPLTPGTGALAAVIAATGADIVLNVTAVVAGHPAGSRVR